MTRASGFTLLELLVVIAIIGSLASLLIPSVRAAMQKARTVECLSDLRQIGMAVHLYTESHNGILPGTSHAISWTNSLVPYLSPTFIGRCPAAKQHRARVTYGWNDCLAPNGVGIAASSVRTPGLTMAMAELAADQTSEHFHFMGSRSGAARITPNQFKAAVNVQLHGTGANYLFVDGHAEHLSWTEVQVRLTQQNSTFILP